MRPFVLLPEETVRENGHSSEVALGPFRGSVLHITLTITRMMEQQTLELILWGSSSGADWNVLATLPHRHYCGVYHDTIDLTEHPEVSLLRVEWRLRSWSHTASSRLVTFSLAAEEVREEAFAAAR